MCRRRASALLAVGLLAGAGSPALAQGSPPERVVEDYLESRGLLRILAAQLRERLDGESNPEERASLAERLADVYVRLLDAAATPAERAEVGALSEDLLRRFPDSDLDELRINLLRARYAPAERTAEEHRLRLADGPEIAQAVETLQSVVREFDAIAQRRLRRIEALESRGGRGSAADETRDELEESRRIHSLARYFAGWSRLYLAQLGGARGQGRLADQAIADFAHVLGLGGEPVTLERLPRGLLGFEHVARAAVGVALALAEQGRDGAAQAAVWITEFERMEQFNAGVRDQLFPRKAAILAAAGRWPDVRDAASARANADPGGEGQLSVSDARLLAVLALEAVEREPSALQVRIARDVAEFALAALIRRGEVAHVLDLTQRFGTFPLGDEGFVVLYVRGIRAYEQARAAHQASGDPPDQPAGATEIQARYSDAAGLLESALASADAGRFPPERARAGVLLGLSLFYEGAFAEAAQRFREAYEAAPDDASAEEALWFAILAHDRAAQEGRAGAAERAASLADRYLERFPRTDRAATLVLRRLGSGELDDEEAIEILAAVPAGSPVRAAAERRLADLLYRRARSGDAAAADRFVPLASRLAQADAERAEQNPGDAEPARSAAARARQILDVALTATPPDAAAARSAFALLDRLARAKVFDPATVADELDFRRLQLALAERRAGEAERLIERLREGGGPFARAAETLLFRRALDAWRAGDAQAARRVAEHGVRLAPPGDAPLAPAEAGIVALAAEAAAALWDAERDAEMRDLAVRLDKRLLAAEAASGAVLRRLGRLAEAAGDAPTAIDAWNRLATASEPLSAPWAEARFNAMRLLADLDPEAARTALRQHAALYPSLGPTPWDERIRGLRLRLDRASKPGGESSGGSGG